MNNFNWKPHLALLIVNALYGAGYSIAKIPLSGYISPAVFILLRVSISLILFALFVYLFIPTQFKIDKSDIVRLALCGLFGVSINQICFFEGLSRTSEMNASLLMILTPILILIIAVVAKEEKFSSRKLFGVILGCIGAFIILFNKGFSYSLQSATIFGDLFIFINAISYSIYLVIVKKLMHKYEPLKVIMYVFLFGLIPVFIYAFPQISKTPFSLFTSSVWMSIIFIVLFVTFTVYLLNIYAISKSDSSLAGTYIYIQPIFAAVFTYLFTNKQLFTYHFIAAIFIFTGVYFVSIRSNKQHLISTNN